MCESLQIKSGSHFVYTTIQKFIDYNKAQFLSKEEAHWTDHHSQHSQHILERRLICVAFDFVAMTTALPV